MDYRKPTLIILNAEARAAGTAFSCFDGISPGVLSLCSTGTGPGSITNKCSVGPAPGSNDPAACYIGESADGGVCESGTSGPSWDTCTSGPVNV